MYSFLSSCFRDIPKPDAAEQIRQQLPEVSHVLSAPVIDACRKVIDSMEDGREKEQLTWNQQYTLLFLTPHGVHPYESVYRGSKKRLMDEPWQKVKDFYLSAGIEKGDDEEHPVDHIAVELGFMAFLSFASIEAETAAERISTANMQKKFLEEHILEWVPALCKDVKNIPEVPLYHAITALASIFVIEDHTCLSGQPAEHQEEA